jgi:hypothetical protein
VQELGFLAFTLPQVEILMPTKNPRGRSRGKRCRIVKDWIRLWKEGVRDLVMELCCALHNFRVRLTPWQPMV